MNGGDNLDNSRILALLEDERPYFKGGGGLTVSGGEPGLQSKELIKLFLEVKAKGFHTALDTNGSFDTKDYRDLLDLTDLALIDLKHFDNDWHLKLTGASNSNVFKTLAYREKTKKPFWIRYVLVPGWTDQVEYLEAAAQYLKDFKYLERLEILPYHNLGAHKYKELGMDYRLEGVSSPSQKKIEEAEEIFKKYLNKVFVRR
jgi:pyruvate formate lyase activating enzyme